MNLLKGTKCYLVGPIERSEDPISWRDRVTEELQEMGIKVYDPMKKPKWAPEKASEATKRGKFLEIINDLNSDHVTLNDIEYYEGIKWIRQVDLRYVHSSDFIVCYLPKMFSMGSCEELTVAINTGKPVLMWSDTDQVPSSWLSTMICDDLNDIGDSFFDSEEDLLKYLRNVNANEIPLDPLKWIFLTYFNKHVKIKGKK